MTDIRTGIGYDTHRLAAGSPCIIGGVEIPAAHGPVGHSDADVLTHAIIDALLGAAALGDIGEHFPDTDPRYKGVDSLTLLTTVKELLVTAGYTICNLDATVALELPKLGPFKEKMRTQLATALTIKPDQVSVKATTGEHIGFVGRGEGVAALAVVTIRKLLPLDK